MLSASAKEEMARGFMLKAMSNQAHNYGKKEFPLYGIPGKDCISRYIRKFKIQPGIQKYFLDLLQIKLSGEEVESNNRDAML